MQNPQASTPFVWGAGGQKLTPKDIARKRAEALALSRGGVPRNVGEGLSAIGNALLSRSLNSRADSAEKSGLAGANADLIAALGLGQPKSTATPSPITPATALTRNPAPTDTGGGNIPTPGPASNDTSFGPPQPFNGNSLDPREGDFSFLSPDDTATANVATPDSPQGGDSIDSYNAGLSRTESGGNYSIVNKEGFGGKYQFGQPKLDDFNNATGQNITMQQFLATPEIQEAAQRWNVQDTDSFISKNGLERFVGQNVGGVVMTQNGMRAMAHLGGQGGLRKFLLSGGQSNPADSNGTRLSDYARTHGQPTQVASLDPAAGIPLANAVPSLTAAPGQASPQALAQPNQVAQALNAQPQQGISPEILRALNNPFTSRGGRAALTGRLNENRRVRALGEQRNFDAGLLSQKNTRQDNLLAEERALQERLLREKREFGAPQRADAANAASNADRASDLAFKQNSGKGPNIVTSRDKNGQKQDYIFDREKGEYVPFGGPKPATDQITLGEDGGLEISKPAKKTVTDAQKSIVSNLESAQSIQTIKKRYKSEYLTYAGKARKWGLKELEKLGAPLNREQKEYIKATRKFTQSVNKEFNAYRKEITGAAAAVQELNDLKKAVLNTELSPSEFEGAIEDYQEGVQRALRLKRQLLREGIYVGSKEFGPAFDEAFTTGADDTAEARGNELSKTGMGFAEVIKQLRDEGYTQ